MAVIASRAIGSYGLGEFFFYFSTVSLFIPIMNLGLEKILILKWMKSSDLEKRRIFTQLFYLKCALGAVTWGLTIALDFFLRGPQANPLAISTAFLAIFFDEFGQLLRAPDRLKLHVRFEIIVPILSRTVCVIGLLIMLPSLTNGYQICLLYAIGNGIGMLVSLGGLHRYWPVETETCTMEGFRSTVKLGITFSFTALFVMVSLYADSVILGRYSISEVGYYNAAYRIILVFGLLSGGIAHSFYPRIADWYHQKDWHKLSHAFSLIFSSFLLIFGSITAICVIEGNELMPFVYGKSFAPSGIAFQILSFVIPLLSLTNFIGQSLEATGNQKMTMNTCLISSLFNVVTNIIFIPYYGMLAAAVITVLTEACSLIFLTIKLNICIPLKLEMKLFYGSLFWSTLLIIAFLFFHAFGLLIALTLDALAFIAVLYIFKKIYINDYFTSHEEKS